MTDIPALFIEHFATVWKPFYWPLIVLNLVLGFVLLRVVRRPLLQTIQALSLFLMLLIISAVAFMLGSETLGRGLQEMATVILGAWLIRQAGLAFFRLVLARLGLHPPRILEELLILLAYLGWLLMRLSHAGFDLSSLLASTAVVTAVLAFAMQDTLGNILSGLALQLDHSIHIGDWLQTDTVTGKVVQVQWRHTAVRTLFGETVLIPNSVLMKSQVTLIGGPSAPKRLRTVLFYSGFELAPNNVVEVVQDTLANADLLDIANTPPPVCAVLDFANGVVTYAVRYWLLNPEAPGGADSLIRQHVYALFMRQGWRMAAPAHDVHLGGVSSGINETLIQQDMKRRREILGAIALFKPLTEDELGKLAGRLNSLSYLAGSVITRQGETGDCLFILTRGQADVLLQAHDHSRHLATLAAGQVMGEMSLMTGEPRRATLKARTDVNCYTLTKADFEEILQLRPELAEAFAQMLAQRSQELQDVRNTMPATQVAAKKADILARMRRMFGLGGGM